MRSCLKEIYGCTLIAYIEFESFWYALQIGDGDLAISYDGNAYSKPIPEDDKCVGNITTSLCGEDSYKDFRFAHGEKMPDIILCSSDGMANSVAGDKGLFNLYKWYVERFYNAEFEKCKKCEESNRDDEMKCNLDCRIKEAKKIIEKNLSESSKRGSGDDFSLAAIIRLYTDDTKKNCIKKYTYYRHWENSLSKSLEQDSLRYLTKSADFGNQEANLLIGNMLLGEFEKKIKISESKSDLLKLKKKTDTYLKKANKLGIESLKKLTLLYADFFMSEFEKSKVFDEDEFSRITESLEGAGDFDTIKKLYARLKIVLIDLAKNGVLSAEQKEAFSACMTFFARNSFSVSDETLEMFFAAVDYFRKTGDDFCEIKDMIRKKYGIDHRPRMIQPVYYRGLQL